MQDVAVSTGGPLQVLVDLIAKAVARLGLLTKDLDYHLIRGSMVLIFLLFVVAITTAGGLWPGLVASVGAFLLLNWFFAPPIHTFTIGNTRDLLALIAFLVIALLTVIVTWSIRRMGLAK